MRMQENYSGCRVLAYCVMSNHFHILLEVPPKNQSNIPDKIYDFLIAFGDLVI
jgi:REP element-mobilizing transposase RayT